MLDRDTGPRSIRAVKPQPAKAPVPPRPSTLDPDVFRPQHEPVVKPEAPKSAWGRGMDIIGDWAEVKSKPAATIPTSEPGRVRSGISDPQAIAVAKRTGKPPKPTPFLEKLSNSFLNLGGRGGDPIEGTEDKPLTTHEALDITFTGPLMTGAEIVNDVNSRVGSFRRDLANDPDSTKDDPVYEYPEWLDKNGVPFTSNDRDLYYKLSNGMVVGNKELSKSKRIDERTLKLADGRKVPIALLPADQAGWDKIASHFGFPDGTVTMYADGSVPEGLQEPVKRQLPAKSLISRLAGPADPRAPWQDKAGHDLWDKDYDITQSAANEFLPWLVDMNLSSLPYYMPYYNIISGAAAAAPWIGGGYEGSSYAPKGHGFQNLGSLGQGTYADRETTHGQRVGGVMNPVMNAAAERFSGQAVGGIPAFMRSGAAGRFLTQNPFGRVIGSAFTEGAEEIASSPFQQLEQDSLKNFGRDKYWNEVEGKNVYDPTTARGATTGSTMFQDFLAGAVLGAGMTGGYEARAAVANRGQAKLPQMPEIARARTRAQILEDERLSTLEQAAEDSGAYRTRQER